MNYCIDIVTSSVLECLLNLEPKFVYDIIYKPHGITLQLILKSDLPETAYHE